MYLRYTARKKDGKVHRYWTLVRSVRVSRRVIQQTVAQLGELDEHGRLQARALARHWIGEPEQARLFDDGSGQATVPVRLKGVRIERSRQFPEFTMPRRRHVVITFHDSMFEGLAHSVHASLTNEDRRTVVGKITRLLWGDD
jgi:hypothetical protein